MTITQRYSDLYYKYRGYEITLLCKVNSYNDNWEGISDWFDSGGAYYNDGVLFELLFDYDKEGKIKEYSYYL